MSLITWKNTAIVLAIVLAYILFVKPKQKKDGDCGCKGTKETKDTTEKE